MRRALGLTAFPSLLAVAVLAALAGVSVGVAQEGSFRHARSPSSSASRPAEAPTSSARALADAVN